MKNFNRLSLDKNKKIYAKVAFIDFRYFLSILILFIFAFILTSCTNASKPSKNAMMELEGNKYISQVNLEKKDIAINNTITQEELFCLEQGGYEGEIHEPATMLYYTCLAERLNQLAFFGVAHDLTELKEQDIEYLELLASKYRAKAKDSIDAYTRQQSEIVI